MEGFINCKLCMDKFESCHQYCEKYLSAKEEHNKKKEIIDKRRNLERLLNVPLRRYAYYANK